MAPLSIIRFLQNSVSRPRHPKAKRRPLRCRPSTEGLEARLALAITASGPYEIAYVGGVGADGTGPSDVLLASGSNPISAEAWNTYTPPAGYIKNTTRNPTFESQVILTSPDSSTGASYVTTSDGYTWVFVTQTVRR